MIQLDELIWMKIAHLDWSRAMKGTVNKIISTTANTTAASIAKGKRIQWTNEEKKMSKSTDA